MVNFTSLPKRLIVSGASGAGKTTACQHLLVQMQAAGGRISGILSPPRFEEGRKTGIFARNLHSGEQRLLASCLPGEIDGLRFGQWYFDRTVLEWGNAALAAAPLTDLLLIDELGPLEFDWQQGWTAAFDLLARPAAGIMIVTVRPACLEPLHDLWPHSVARSVEELRQFDLTPTAPLQRGVSHDAYDTRPDEHCWDHAALHKASQRHRGQGEHHEGVFPCSSCHCDTHSQWSKAFPIKAGIL